MINTQNTTCQKLLTQNDIPQNDSKYFEFSAVGKPGDINRMPYFKLPLIY